MRAIGLFGAALLLSALGSAAWATGAFKVFPVRLSLSPARPVETMTVENTGAEPARMQLRVYAWRQENGSDRLEETRDILANPALFEMAPGESQIARLGLRVAPGAREKAYRVILDEVPPPGAARAGEIRTLLRISIPLFVPAPGTAPELQWRATADAEAVTLHAVNRGGAHIQIHRIALKDARGGAIGAEDFSRYLLPGTSADLAVKTAVPVRAGAALHVEAVTDNGALSVDLRVGDAGNAAGGP